MILTQVLSDVTAESALDPHKLTCQLTFQVSLLFLSPHLSFSSHILLVSAGRSTSGEEAGSRIRVVRPYHISEKKKTNGDRGMESGNRSVARTCAWAWHTTHELGQRCRSNRGRHRTVVLAGHTPRTVASSPPQCGRHRIDPTNDHHLSPVSCRWPPRIAYLAEEKTRKKEMPRTKLQDEEVRFQEVPTISHCSMKSD